MTIEELKALLVEERDAVTDAIKSEYEERDTKRADEHKTVMEELEKLKDEYEKQIGDLCKVADRKNLPPGDEEPKLWKNLGTFAIDVFRWGLGNHSDAMKTYVEKAATDALSEAVDSEGGFLVPEEFRAELLRQAIELADLLPRCTEVPMATNTVKIPYMKDTDHSGGTIHGGIRFYFVAEKVQATETEPQFGQVELSLHDMIGLYSAGNSLLEDSPISLGAVMEAAFKEAFSWQMDYEILNGTGAGSPQGILNAPVLVEVAKETQQEATSLVYTNVINMWARMPNRNKRNAVWVMNDDVIPHLYKMNLSVGTGGAPVFLPENGAASAPYDRLFGRPIAYTEHCQTLGTKGDIYLGDFTQYLIGRKVGSTLQAESSLHLRFDYNQQVFRFVYRVAGASWWPAALTPRHSSNTMSPFIALADR